ncbi:MAG: DNRLRE domain-containing protein [Clostridia bacterium]|nr:DNRLRE domain-containing protein [Clostridia bacterium]
MKKLLSIILSFVLIMSTLPMIASAETTLDAIVASQDCPVRRGTDAKKNLNTEKDGYNWCYANTATYSTPTYYSFDLPEIPEGETVTKAMFKVHFMDTTNVAGATTYQFRFYPVNASWDQTTLTFNTQPLTMTGKFPDYEPALTYDIPKGAKNSSTEYDIAPLVRQYLASGADYDFSFAILTYIANGTTNGAANIYSLENADSSLHPTLTLTTDSIPGFSFESVSVEDGATIAPTDDVTFSFNNEVDPASVSASDFSVKDFAGNPVEIAEGDFSVSGTNVILSKDLAPYDAYTVSLSGVADIYGQEFAGSASVSFVTDGGDNLVESNIILKDSVKMTNSNGTISFEAASQSANLGKYAYPKNSSNKQIGYIVFRFDLSSLDTTKNLAGVNFKWVNDYDWKGTLNVYEVPYGEWTQPSEADEAYYQAVESAVESAVGDASNLAASYPFDYGNKRGSYEAIVDVTEKINDAIANEQTGIAFTFVYDSKDTIYTHNIYNEKDSRYLPALMCTSTTPTFDVIQSTPAKGGVMDGIIEPVEMTLATALTDETATADYIKLVKASNGDEVNATISYENGKLTVTPSAELEERTAYQIVFKAGLEDTFGNVVAEDKIVNSFKTSTALEFFGIKITNELTPVYDTCVEIENYTANTDVTAVAKIKNNSSSDLDAVMLIAIYGEDHTLIAADLTGGIDCAPANDETQFSKTITVPEDASATYIKAFIWDNVNTIRPIFEHALINQAQ